MDDVSKIEIQRTVLGLADHLETFDHGLRVQTFNAMVKTAFELDAGARAQALHINALLVSEIRERGVRL